MIGEHDVDLDAAHRGHVEGLADGVVGEEVGCHDPHRLLRGGQRPHQHELDSADVGIVRSEADAAGERRARHALIRGPGPVDARGGRITDERLARRKRPVFHEDFEQLRDHGPAQLEVHVTHGVGRRVGEPTAVADVEAAGKPDRAVDHEDLAMVAQVGVGEVERRRRGQKSLRAHAPGGEHTGDRRIRVARADAVDKHPHCHPTAHCPSQGLGEDCAGGIVVEDVRREADAPGGGVDRGEHPRIGLVAPGERADRVAVDERPIRHLADECGQRPQRGPWRADRGGEPLGAGDRCPELVNHGQRPGPQLGRPGANSIDPQHRIGDRPEHRRQPDQAHPPDGGARVALDEDRMGARQHVDGEDGKREHVRPDDQPPPPCRRQEGFHAGKATKLVTTALARSSWCRCYRLPAGRERRLRFVGQARGVEWMGNHEHRPARPHAVAP